MVIMKPSPTDNEDVPHRYRNLLARTGLTAGQVRTIYLLARQQRHYRTHRQIRARVEHVRARLKDWQVPRQHRRRGQVINHSLRTVAGPGSSRPTNHYGPTLNRNCDFGEF